jgi:hypothetical protein
MKREKMKHENKKNEKAQLSWHESNPRALQPPVTVSYLPSPARLPILIPLNQSLALFIPPAVLSNIVLRELTLFMADAF